MTRITVTTEVGEDREVRFKLPDEVPTGRATLEVVVEPCTEADQPPIRTLGDLLHSEFFGMWKDREDITDSVEFARKLRYEAWRRSGSDQ